MREIDKPPSVADQETFKLTEKDRWGKLVWIGSYDNRLDNFLLAISQSHEDESIGCVLDRTPAELVSSAPRLIGYATFVSLFARLEFCGLYDGPKAAEVFTTRGVPRDEYKDIPLRELTRDN